MIITEPAAAPVQATFLRAHLRLMAVGMKNSRMTGRQMLDKATAITGKDYKRGQYGVAVNDLTAIIDAAKKAT